MDKEPLIAANEATAAAHISALEDALAAGMRDIVTGLQNGNGIVMPVNAVLRIERAMNDLVHDASRTMGESVMETLTKADETLWDRIVRAYMETYGGQAITNITQTTQRQIMQVLAAHPEMGIADVAQLIREKIPVLSHYRAALIARTETHSAGQFASQKVAETIDVSLMKKWNATEDHRTRDMGQIGGVEEFDHRAMDEVKVALDQPFRVPNKYGGWELLMFPGDPIGSPANIINCRCVQTYARA